MTAPVTPWPCSSSPTCSPKAWPQPCTTPPCTWPRTQSGEDGRDVFAHRGVVVHYQCVQRSRRHQEGLRVVGPLARRGSRATAIAISSSSSDDRRTASAALGADAKQAEALRVLDEGTLPVEGSKSGEEDVQASRLNYVRERYALQLAERLKDRDRAAKAAAVLAKAELAADVWYEVARLCIATDLSGGVAPQLPAESRSDSATASRRFASCL